MRSLSTHVLDAVSGAPAAAVGVRVDAWSAGTSGTWVTVTEDVTDADGRAAGLAPDGMAPGTYRLVFDTAGFFQRSGQAHFYPEVSVCFTVDDDRHYHVPLLLSPFAYSTYRGS